MQMKIWYTIQILTILTNVFSTLSNPFKLCFILNCLFQMLCCLQYYNVYLQRNYLFFTNKTENMSIIQICLWAWCEIYYFRLLAKHIIACINTSRSPRNCPKYIRYWHCNMFWMISTSVDEIERYQILISHCCTQHYLYHSVI